MVSFLDKLREADAESYIKMDLEELPEEIKWLYVADDKKGLVELYNTLYQNETRFSDTPTDEIRNEILNYMDWFSQAADAMLKLGKDGISLHHLGHSKRITGPICDFFRQTTGYEPNF